MARIEGIRIKNFRGLKDVALGRTSDTPESEPLTAMTVVIGKNGVGKSTLFDAFGFLADALKFGVEEACDLRGRGGFEKIHSQGQSGLIEFEIRYRENQEACPITYLTYIGIDGFGRPFVQLEFLLQHFQKRIGGQSNALFILLSGKGFVWRGVGKKIDDGGKGIDPLKINKLFERIKLEPIGVSNSLKELEDGEGV